MKFTKIAAAATALAVAGPAAADTWDMPMAYSGSNFHSVTGAEFAQCVTTGTGGEIEIVTHPGGSLYAGADIKRAIQTGQVPNRRAPAIGPSERETPSFRLSIQCALPRHLL